MPPRLSRAMGRAGWPVLLPALLLLLTLLLGTAPAAQAQISNENTNGPSRADTRRAQREARRTGQPLPPNFDTHLDRRRRQLRRGEGDQPRPEGADAYDYQTGNSPSESDRNIWGLRRKKTKPKE